MHLKFLRVAKFAAVSAAVAGFSMTAQAETTSDYVQDGLVAMWDAYENIGPGLHADNPGEWVDVVGGAKLTVGDGEYFDGDSFFMQNASHSSDKAILDAFSEVTFEYYARPTYQSGTGNWHVDMIGIGNIGGFGWDGRNGAISIYRYDNDTPTQQQHYLSYSSGYGSIVDLIKAKVFRTYSATIGINSSAVYVNAVSRNTTSGLNWSGGTRSSSLKFVTGASQTRSQVKNLRVYNRKLTAEEISKNRQVDAARFESGNLGVLAKVRSTIAAFDGEPHGIELTVISPESGYTQEWSSDGGATYSATEPLFTEPGVHNVRCRLTREGSAPIVVTADATVYRKGVRLAPGALLSTEGPHTNFVALVRLSPDLTPGFSADDVQAGGADVRFFDEEGRPLAHEIDTWDPAGTNLFWVLLPELTPSMTFFATWGYGEGVPLSPYVPTAVWRDYTAVWHFNETSGPAADATGHGCTANVIAGREGTSIGVADTPLGSGLSRGNAMPSYSLSVADYTDRFPIRDNFLYMSGWFCATNYTAGSYPAYWSKRTAWGANGFSCNMQAAKDKIISAGNGSAYRLVDFPDITKSGWFRLAVGYTTNWLWLFRNGNFLDGGSAGTVTDVAGVSLSIGGIEGRFDELRLRRNRPNLTSDFNEMVAIEKLEYGQVANPRFFVQMATGRTTSQLAAAVKVSAVLRTVSIAGSIIALGDGETSVRMLCGASADDLAAVGEPVALTDLGAFTVTVDCSAVIGYGSASYFAVEMTNGDTVQRSDVVALTPIDTATYVWTQGGADNEWTNAANWVTSPAHDRKAYPQDNVATVKFMPCAEGQRWSVHLGRSITVKTLDMSGGNVRADFSSEGVKAALTIGPGDANLMSGTSNVVTFSDMNVNYTTTKSAGGNCYLYGQLTFVRSKLECWEWADVYFWEKVTFKDSVLNIYSTSLHLNSDLVIDNSQINKTGIFLPVGAHTASGDVGTVTFKGKNPYLKCSRVTTYWTSADRFGRFVFEVPEGGFETQPVVDVTESGYKVFYNSAQSTIEVDPASPIFAANLKEPLTQHLISAAGGFNSAVITLGDLPKRNVRAGSAFYWMEKGVRYEEKADTRTALYVTIATPRSGMQVLVK